MAFTGTDVMTSQQYLDLLTELNALKTAGTLTKGRHYYIGDTKAIAVANASNEFIPLYENAIGSNLKFTATTSLISYKTAFGVDKELSLADLVAATATKLATKRKIWGQDFDGSAPITGAFSGATTGSFSEAVTIGGHLTVGSADGSYVQIGALRLVYDATNNAIKLLDPNPTPKNANFYATGSVAAFGPGTVSGGGSTSDRLDTWTGYDDDTMSTKVLSAGLGYDMYTRITNLEENPPVSFGSATSSYVPLTVGSTTRNISISGHLHTIGNITGLQTALDGKLNKGDYSKNSNVLTGANVFSDIIVENGLVTHTATRALTKGNIGLGNVDNTSDANKPISTAVSAALEAKAPINNPVFTGTPKSVTAATSTNDTQIATTAFVHAVVTSAVSSVFTYKGTATVNTINGKINGSTAVGSAYRLTDAGKITNAVDADKDAAAGDMVICTQANPIQWSILQNNIDTADLESRIDTVETLLTWILPAS